MDKVESISVYPAAPPKTSKIIYYTRMALFGLTSVTVMLAVCMLMLPTLLVYSMRHPLLLVSHKTNHKRIESAFYTFYRHIVRFIEGIWGSFVIVLCFLLTPGKIIITGDSSGMGETLRCVVMANHQIYPDWIYLWALARKYNHHGNLKLFLMASLKYLPFAGFGMWFFEFIFLERKLALDRKNILNSMSKLRELVPNDPLFLLLFPEGTLNTPNNRANTRAFAKKNDITIDPEFVLLPKATGLFMAVESLPRVDTLFDVTVGYNGLTREQVPFAEYLVENCYFAGKYPTVVHLHIRRFNVRQVPGFDGKITDENFERTEMKKEMADAFDPLTNARKDAFGLWVRDRWMEKDELMRGFYKTGAFPSSKQDVEWELKPSTTDVLLVLFAWTCLFFFGWAFFSALFSSCWMLVKLAFRVAKK